MFKMGQKENLNLLLQLHHIITGSNMELEEIVNRRTVEPDISLIYNSELGGKVAFGNRVSINKYYSLGELIDVGSEASERT
jgi:hypothetical protein